MKRYIETYQYIHIDMCMLITGTENTFHIAIADTTDCSDANDVIHF